MSANFLEIAKRKWPQSRITGSGCFAVILCHYVRLEELPMFAMQTRRASCGEYCYGIHRHKIVELKPETEKPIFRQNNSLQKAMAED